MGHGEQVGSGGHFWPKLDETPDGAEIRGTFIGEKSATYQGEKRKAAAFQVGEDVMLITATGFVDFWMPELTVGNPYYVKFLGMVKTKSGNKAFTFKVFNDDCKD